MDKIARRRDQATGMRAYIECLVVRWRTHSQRDDGRIVPSVLSRQLLAAESKWTVSGLSEAAERRSMPSRRTGHAPGVGPMQRDG